MRTSITCDVNKNRAVAHEGNLCTAVYDFNKDEFEYFESESYTEDEMYEDMASEMARAEGLTMEAYDVRQEQGIFGYGY